MTKLPPILAEIRKRPGMYLPVTTYEAAVAFVSGYDGAVCGGLLWAFREWLIVKLKDGNNLSWPALVLQVWDRDSAPLTERSSPDEHLARIESLFALIDDFLNERQGQNGGRAIFAAYEEWLQRQEWYSPSSPEWLPPLQKREI